MVLYDNIKVGQRVEVLLYGEIVQGTVRFKGCLNGVPGDWVGVDLDKKLGRHEGMINGRRYFQCPPKHGVFVTANKIRFIRANRYSYDPYLTVEQEPLALVDHQLFADNARDDLFDLDEYENDLHVAPYRSSRSSLHNRSYSPVQPPPFPPSHSFHRSHLVGHRLPTAAMRSPEAMRRSMRSPEPVRRSMQSSELMRRSMQSSELERRSMQSSELVRRSMQSPEPVRRSMWSPEPGRRSMRSPEPGRRSYVHDPCHIQPKHTRYEYDRENFISSPSIPKTHMPHSALSRQVERGWDYNHYPREMSVYNGRDSIKFDTWNDIC